MTLTVEQWAAEYSELSEEAMTMRIALVKIAKGRQPAAEIALEALRKVDEAPNDTAENFENTIPRGAAS